MIDEFSIATWVHFVSALVAIAAGGILFLNRKGTWRHRLLGRTYLGAMAALLAASAFMPATVMPFFGTRFGFFHIFLLIGALSLAVGIACLRRWRRTRDPKALKAHQVHLAYSYAGLLMAGVSQVAINPRFLLAQIETASAFWASFIGVNLAIYAVAVYLIQTRIAKTELTRFLSGSEEAKG
jgi:uncharacterized membrane protein